MMLIFFREASPELRTFRCLRNQEAQVALDLLQLGVAALLRAAAARAAAAPASAPAPPLHTAPLHPDRDVRHREPKADHGAGSGCEDRAAAAALLAPFRTLPGTDGATLPNLPNAHGDRVRSPNGWLSTSKEALFD